jgi:hypothetical protein
MNYFLVMLISFLSTCLSAVGMATALRIPLRTYADSAPFARHEKRSSSILQVVDAGNAEYLANITVGGYVSDQV